MKITAIKQNVSAQIITGFLGSGKTSFILNLLKAKPKNVRWAILVNEVGKTTYPVEALERQGVFIKAIISGCLCCSGGLVFKNELNRLVKEVRPDHIIIEPAGFGHLSNIKTLLKSEYYQKLLTLKPTLCLVNEDQLQDPRYSENSNYQSLIEESNSLVIVNPKSKLSAIEISNSFKKSCDSIYL